MLTNDLSSGKCGTIIRTTCTEQLIMTFKDRAMRMETPSWQIDCQDDATPVFVCWNSEYEMAAWDVGDTYPLQFGYDTQGCKTRGQTTRDDGVTWDETRWTFDAESVVAFARSLTSDIIRRSRRCCFLGTGRRFG